MKLYRITLIDRYGSRQVVTLAGSSLYEAMKHIELDPGWTFEGYSVMGVSSDV